MRPAQRRPHRVQAQAVRISGSFLQGTAAQPQIKSLPATSHACSLSTNRRHHNNRLRAEVPRRSKFLFFAGKMPMRSGPSSATRDGLRQQKGRLEAGLLVAMRILSIPRTDRTTPAEAIVHADLDGMLV